MSGANGTIMEVIVCQRGARHRYAVPVLFEQAGVLSALYTDSCRYSTLGRCCAALCRLGITHRGAASLAARDPKGVPAAKVHSSDRAAFPRFLGGADSLAHVYRRWGLGEAGVIYSMYGEELDFLRWAKARGAKLIVDVFVHPRTNRIVAEEEIRLLGASGNRLIEREDHHTREAFEMADLLLCPSRWVADGVTEFSGEYRHKIRIIPYGSSVGLAAAINRPGPGTVLFAGREPLRKGLQHLAEAAHMLRQAGREMEFRVAGVSDSEIDWMPFRSELTCLGKIPMEQMKQEYAAADVFVLPSLSEGQAGALLEAMACGLPVIATRESGVDFDPGCGVTVPAGAPEVLARAIESVVTDRSRRTALAEGALRQAGAFSMEKWGERLLEVIRELNG